MNRRLFYAAVMFLVIGTCPACRRQQPAAPTSVSSKVSCLRADIRGLLSEMWIGQKVILSTWASLPQSRTQTVSPLIYESVGGEYSSSRPDVATVTYDSARRGILTGIGPGETTIHAVGTCDEGNRGVTVLNATEPPPDRVTLQTMASGINDRYNVTAIPAGRGLWITATIEPSRREVTTFADWRTSDPSIATFGSDHLLNALRAGMVDVRATYLGVTATIPMAVLPSDRDNVAAAWYRTGVSPFAGNAFAACAQAAYTLQSASNGRISLELRNGDIVLKTSDVSVPRGSGYPSDQCVETPVAPEVSTICTTFSLYPSSGSTPTASVTVECKPAHGSPTPF